MLNYNPFDWYWVVGGNEAQVYSSRRRAMISIYHQEFTTWLAGEPMRAPTHIPSMDELKSVLRDRGVPPYHRVRKSTIISRLTDEQLSEAISLMTVRQQERWRAPDQPAVNADDPETIAILQAVGADDSVVLAPE